MTSAVTASPSAFAARTSSTDPAVDRCRKCMGAPVRRTRAMSRANISSSASTGWPAIPRRLDQGPSFMCPPAASWRSSQCSASTTPSPEAYSSARRMRPLFCTPRPSSVKRRTPRAASSAIGASFSPRRPTVMAPATAISAKASSPSASTSRATAPESMAGSVFGMATRAVYPPRAAALEADSTVSAISPPGSRRWAWRSTSPGETTQPAASRTTAPFGASIVSSTATMRPSFTRTSPRRSPVSSTRVPPRTTTSPACPDVL